MRIGRAVVVVAAVAAAFALASANTAFAGGNPVTGAAFTTVDTNVDLTGHCQNGNPQNNCNQYDGKKWVWLNGGPVANKLGGDGTYFFAVLDPDGQQSPNDGTPGNLSDDYDCWQNREFTVKNGEFEHYLPSSDAACNNVKGTGTVVHDFDPTSSPPLIRLYPYADTKNPGGVYIAAICKVPEQPTGAPGITPSECKYDAFKVPTADITPPTCQATTSIAGGKGMITIEVQDVDSGIETITPIPDNVTVSLPSWNVGSGAKLTVSGTQIDPSTDASLSVTVTNVAGLSSTCGATIPHDTVNPTCTLFGLIPATDGRTSIQVFVQDAGGLKSIVPVTVNATSDATFTNGTTDPVLVTATKIDKDKGAFLKLTVTDLAGNKTVCDPVLPGMKRVRLASSTARRAVSLAAEQRQVTVRNGSGRSQTVTVRLNGRTFTAKIGAHATRLIDLSRAMIPARTNHAVVRHTGGRGAVVVTFEMP